MKKQSNNKKWNIRWAGVKRRIFFIFFAGFLPRKLTNSLIPQRKVWGRKTAKVPTAIPIIPQKTIERAGKVFRVALAAGLGSWTLNVL